MYLYNNRRKYVAGGAIGRKTLERATIELTKSAYVYAGVPLTPTATVKLDGATLVANRDYIVSYQDNVDVGIATVAATGIGAYYGSASTTFYILSSSSNWAAVDFTQLAWGADASTQLVYNSTSIVKNVQHIQIVKPSGTEMLHFSSLELGRAFIWGWTLNGEFDVSKFTASPSPLSPSVSTAYYGSALLRTDDGLGGVDCGSMSAEIKPYTTTAAYNIKFTTSQSGQYQFDSRTHGNAIALTANPVHMAFSADGKKFYYKAGTDNMLYCRNLTTAFDFSTMSATDDASVNLNGFDEVTWRDFTFAPDGLNMVATSGDGTGTVHMFSLTEAWNIESIAQRTSQKQLFSSGAYLNAVVLNDTGTKMIVFNGGDNNFYGYTLVPTGGGGGGVTPL